MRWYYLCQRKRQRERLRMLKADARDPDWKL